MKTDKGIIENCNGLARELYALQGYQRPEEFKFYEANHPQEIRAWTMAVKAYDFIEGTEVESAMDNEGIDWPKFSMRGSE